MSIHPERAHGSELVLAGVGRCEEHDIVLFIEDLAYINGWTGQALGKTHLQKYN
jgi:hypothetical protein